MAFDVCGVHVQVAMTRRLQVLVLVQVVCTCHMTAALTLAHKPRRGHG